MSENSRRLDDLTIASPCAANWDDMSGDERARFCGSCRLHVYDLSGLSRKEAERLVFRQEGRLCVRFFRREDGTILTRDCPVGLAAARARLARLAAFVLGLFAMLGTAACKKEQARKFPGTTTTMGLVMLGEPPLMGKPAQPPKP
jgi:hypothetical protein